MFSEYCILDLIVKKRDGDELSEEEIYYFVKVFYLLNGVFESQIGVMFMVMYLKGLNWEEMVSFIKVMFLLGSFLMWFEEW